MRSKMTDYFSVNRTLCPKIIPSPNYIDPDPDFEHVFVEVSTPSEDAINFRAMLFRQEIFQLEMNKDYETAVSPSAPIFFYFKHPAEVDVALLKMTSVDSLCMTLSVQNVTCPVHDLESTVGYDGLYQVNCANDIFLEDLLKRFA